MAGASDGMLHAPFLPPPMLRNRHVQSMASRWPIRRRRIARDAAALLSGTSRMLIDCGEGVRLAGFLTRAKSSSRGLIVMLHGWEGCADSSYMLSAGALLHGDGFDVFRLNLRDHGDTHDLNEDLFHSCRIDEVVNAIHRLQTDLEPRRLALVGQSLGGNFAIRVAVRAPHRGIALDRVFAVAPVLNPVSTMHALDNGLWIYRRYFLSRWRQSLYKKARLFPHIYQFGDLRRFDTLSATTDYFVRNYTEIDTLDDYLNGYALIGDRLEGLTVPTRALLAADDPVIPIDDLERLAEPPALEVVTMEHGGHCGFVESLGRGSWADSQIRADLSARF